MAVEWTSATLVKQRLKGVADLWPDESEIDSIIESIESSVCAMVRSDLLTDITYNLAKHGILGEYVTSTVAAIVIGENPSNYSSSSDAQTAADINWASANRILKQLMKQETITYLKGL